MASGYPGIFPGGLTTSYTNIGAVQKERAGASGYPGVFPGGLSTGYVSIGAVSQTDAVEVIEDPARSRSGRTRSRAVAHSMGLL